MEDVIVKIDTENLWVSRKAVIQVISDLGQAKSFVQADNHLYYLIQVKRLTHLKRLGRVVAAQATTTEQSIVPGSRWNTLPPGNLTRLARTARQVLIPILE